MREKEQVERRVIRREMTATAAIPQSFTRP